MLLLLDLHLVLHPLLAGDDVPWLVGIVGGIKRLCQAAVNGISTARKVLPSLFSPPVRGIT